MIQGQVHTTSEEGQINLVEESETAAPSLHSTSSLSSPRAKPRSAPGSNGSDFI